MSETKMDIIIRAKDQSKSTFKGVEKNMKGLNKTAKKLAGTVAGLFAFKKIKDFLEDTTRAFGEQERAEAKLESIMRRVNNATNDQLEAMKNQAKEMQKVTTVGDEVTLALQAQLGTFALSSDAVMELTESTLSLAVANKGVNVTQEDMINYGNLVGKVMAGNVGSLSRYGVVLSDAQKEQIKMGDEMERASVLAEVLEGNYGKLARDMKNTWEGQVQSFKNEWGDLKEMIGEKLMPLLLQLVEWGTVTGIPALIEAGSWLKERWEQNFLGIRTIVDLSVKAIKTSFEGWILIIDRMIAAWDRAVQAYERFKANVGSGFAKPQNGFVLDPVRSGDVLVNPNSSPVNLAKGGVVPTSYASRGAIFRSRGTDSVPAMLTPGEMVLNKDQQSALLGSHGDTFNITFENSNFSDETSKTSIIEDLKRTIQLAKAGAY